ncbi:hypothetical protein Sjap_015836 [Stephania japonica]|uniref:Protein kinase domain-containing protein n=1 Tax=Stephania japonica TaxID=461633 RepID=A0AAP0NSX2_9MAGN
MKMSLLVFALSLISVSTLLSIHSLALTEDGKTLLEIKGQFNDSRNTLWNWRATDASPCNWTGISCYPNEDLVRSINLPYMQLGGIISSSVGKLRRLQRLALHQNSLHGPIPAEIAQCAELRAMDLSSNSLKGSIPPSIGQLKRLLTLFVGNLDLCGLPIQKPCLGALGFPAVLPHSKDDEPQGKIDSFPTNNKHSTHYVHGILIGAMSTLGVALVALLIFLWICFLAKKERVSKKYTEMKKQVVADPSAKLITFHGDLPYSSWEIIEKLELLSEENVVGSGGFGTVYKMVMNDCSIFAVKRIDRSREGSDKVFERELEILGSIKHINLVNLRGYCRLPSAKLLIYDYMGYGSLDDILHENGQELLPLNWNARLRIALGSARGLAYLHHDCCPTIVHRDIKSSNILLDENLEPRVSDFGLAKLLIDEEAHVTTVVAGTFGYLAPEYLQSGRATEKSDVYSFGVLLLELVTGKRPTDPAFVKRGLNVVGWMNTLIGENRLEDIVDERCIDANVETVEAVLDIAARCTDANPDDRPSMNRVFQMLEEIMSPCPSEFYESHSDYS